MTRPRRAFTLLEVIVALTITGLVATIAYAAMQAGIDTSERLAVRQERDEALANARDLVSAAIRHAMPGAPGGPVTFEVVRRASAEAAGDSLVFLTRGVLEPHGTTSAWRAALWTSRDTLHLRATPVSASPLEVAAQIAGIRALRVRSLARGTFARWRDGWDDPATAPAAVSIAYTGSTGTRLVQVQRVGLERIP